MRPRREAERRGAERRWCWEPGVNGRETRTAELNADANARTPETETRFDAHIHTHIHICTKTIHYTVHTIWPGQCGTGRVLLCWRRRLTSSLRGLGPPSLTAHLCSPFLTLASSILSDGLNGATGAADRAEPSGKSARMWQPASSAEHLHKQGERHGRGVGGPSRPQPSTCTGGVGERQGRGVGWVEPPDRPKGAGEGPNPPIARMPVNNAGGCHAAAAALMCAWKAVTSSAW
jgi:hypothetical protein